MFGNFKVKKLPMHNYAASKLTNWIFFIGQYVNIARVTNSKMYFKFTVMLFKKKTLIWWHAFN